MITVSTITPVYKGEKYLGTLIEELEEVRENWKQNYDNLRLIESIFVIDDAKDNSLAIIEEYSKNRDWIRVLELSKNYGQHPATIAGILHSSGEWIATLDEDLQHRPKYILQFLKKTIQLSADICYGKTSENTHNSYLKDKLAIGFKLAIAKLSGIPFVKDFNSFRLIRGSVARSSAAISSHESYYDIVLCWFTNRVTNVVVPLTDLRNLNEDEESGYSVWGLVRHGKRMIMTSNMKILRLGLVIGIIAFIISIFLAIYALYSTLFKIIPPISQGWSSTILVIIFFGGLLSLMVGVTLESVSDILLNAKGKPPFFVIDRSSDKTIKKELNIK